MTWLSIGEAVLLVKEPPPPKVPADNVSQCLSSADCCSPCSYRKVLLSHTDPLPSYAARVTQKTDMTVQSVQTETLRLRFESRFKPYPNVGCKFAKIIFHVVFLLSRFSKKINLNKKTDQGWQSEQLRSSITKKSHAPFLLKLNHRRCPRRKHPESRASSVRLTRRSFQLNVANMLTMTRLCFVFGRETKYWTD